MPDPSDRAAMIEALRQLRKDAGKARMPQTHSTDPLVPSGQESRLGPPPPREAEPADPSRGELSPHVSYRARGEHEPGRYSTHLVFEDGTSMETDDENPEADAWLDSVRLAPERERAYRDRYGR